MIRGTTKVQQTLIKEWKEKAKWVIQGFLGKTKFKNWWNFFSLSWEILQKNSNNQQLFECELKLGEDETFLCGFFFSLKLHQWLFASFII